MHLCCVDLSHWSIITAVNMMDGLTREGETISSTCHGSSPHIGSTCLSHEDGAVIRLNNSLESALFYYRPMNMHCACLIDSDQRFHKNSAATVIHHTFSHYAPFKNIKIISEKKSTEKEH